MVPSLRCPIRSQYRHKENPLLADFGQDTHCKKEGQSTILYTELKRENEEERVGVFFSNWREKTHPVDGIRMRAPARLSDRTRRILLAYAQFPFSCLSKRSVP
jgi:hypothetical protein